MTPILRYVAHTSSYIERRAEDLICEWYIRVYEVAFTCVLVYVAWVLVHISIGFVSIYIYITVYIYSLVPH